MPKSAPYKAESAPDDGKGKGFWASLGPGVVTGAADDDPSGIATYSIAGAQHGTMFLWCVWLTWPLMTCVQMMCARIGMMTGRGLAKAMRQKFPRPVLAVAAVALLAANTINIAANLSGMADAAQILTGLNPLIFVVVFGAALAFATVKLCYADIAKVLKWLALSLFAYVIAAFMLKPDWGQVLQQTVTITLPQNHNGWATLVAILGTTISPYLFFWQASQEVEEDRDPAITNATLRERRIDVGVGTFFSNAVMFFIILTTALTLHANGQTQIESAKDAALALKPLAGEASALLYSVGLLGVGLLAIPTLSGSAAYALAETFGWEEGLNKPFRRARAFYAVIIAATLMGVALNFMGVKPMDALFWSAVVNGVLAPVLLAGIWLVARDAKIMNGKPSSKFSLAVVGVTVVVMTAAAVALMV